MQKGIFLQDLVTKSGTVNNAIIQLGDIDDSGKGRRFVSKFIQPGLVKIEGHGIVLLKKETLDASLPTIVGSPVIIQHKDVTEENADELRCGVIANAYFNQPDGWYYVDGIIWDDKAQDLINKGWSVSCSYDYLAFNDEGGEENNIHYDKEFTQLNFTHLAIVDNPRYERANIVFNCKINNLRDSELPSDKGKWVTINGNHIFIPDGKSLDEVIEEKGWGDKKNKQSDTKDKQSYDKAKGRAQKALDLAKKAVEGKELSQQEKDWLNSNKSADELSEDKQSDSADKDSKIQEALGDAINEYYSDDVAISGKTMSKLKKLAGRDVSEQEIKDIMWQVTTDHDWDKAIERLKGSKEDRDADAFRKNREQERKNKFKGDKVKAFLNEEYDGGNITADSNKMKKLASFLGVDFKDLDDDRIQDIFEYSGEDYQYFESHTDEENRDYDIERTAGKLKSYAKELVHKKQEDKKEQKQSGTKDKQPQKPKEKQANKISDDELSTKIKELAPDSRRWEWESNKKEITVYFNDPKSKSADKQWNKLLDGLRSFGIKDVMVARNSKTNNSKEQDMAIIEELKKLIFKVENNKENETMVKNEKVDKRKLIDEVAGIMKSAGCDDEDIRTAIGKMEKIGYDDSEASADNKKVKNEADEEDKKVDNEEDEKEEDKKEDKVDNESDEDKEKAEDLKEEEKKDVENKCKNSVGNAKGGEFFDKINKIYNSAKKVEEPSVEYESKQARLEAGKEYFG